MNDAIQRKKWQLVFLLLLLILLFEKAKKKIENLMITPNMVPGAHK